MRPPAGGPRETLKWTVLTLAIALAGGLAADALGLSAGLLIGSAVAVSAAALCGVRATIPVRLRDVAFVLIGMALGTNVAADTLSLLPQWPVTLAALAVGLVVIVWGTGLVLSRVFGLDRGTAYLSAFPGHLSFILAIAEAGVGNPRQIAIIQSVRVLLLTIVVPVFAAIAGADMLGDVAPRAPLEPRMLALLAIACTAGGFLLHAFRAPAAFVLGSMFVAIIGKLGGFYEGVLPEPLIGFSFVVMGALIGSRFTGVGWREFGRASLGGVVVTLSAVLVISVAALLCAQVVDMPFGQIWLGLAPGGLEAMGALGIALGYDTGFIAAHHTMRLLMMSIAIPLVAAAARGRRPAHEKATIDPQSGQDR